MKLYILTKETIYDAETRILGVFSTREAADAQHALICAADSERLARPEPDVYYDVVDQFSLDDATLISMHTEALNCLKKQNNPTEEQNNG